MVRGLAALAVPVVLVAGAPAAAASEFTMFRTPSGNVGCVVDDGGVSCTIREATWAPPPRPANCDGDWGQSLALTAERARFVCAGDTVLEPGAPVLAYGRSIRVAGFVCTSRKSGLRCEHARGGHGFTLSRASYRLF